MTLVLTAPFLAQFVLILLPKFFDLPAQPKQPDLFRLISDIS